MGNRSSPGGRFLHRHKASIDCSDNGKPVERRGRKASGLRPGRDMAAGPPKAPPKVGVCSLSSAADEGRFHAPASGRSIAWPFRLSRRAWLPSPTRRLSPCTRPATPTSSVRKTALSWMELAGAGPQPLTQTRTAPARASFARSFQASSRRAFCTGGSLPGARPRRVGCRTASCTPDPDALSRVERGPAPDPALSFSPSTVSIAH